MAHDYKLSDLGLKLIKAFEGYRARLSTLVSGQMVIGYGHEWVDGEAVHMDKAEAEAVLRSDLHEYEALVNEHVYAPLSQSQFDALVSLAYNIGLGKFLNSKVLQALNSGHPLIAAQAFEDWVKARIGSKVYIVDALVRRRAAEKAVFLRVPSGVVPVPRYEIPPQQADGLAKLEDDEVFELAGDAGIVTRMPYDEAAGFAHRAKRRKEDGPAGTLGYSERQVSQPDWEGEFPDDHDWDDHDWDNQDKSGQNADTQTTNPETEDTHSEDTHISPIALAAAEVSARLDALIADGGATDDGESEKTGGLSGDEDDRLSPLDLAEADMLADEGIDEAEAVTDMPWVEQSEIVGARAKGRRAAKNEPKVPQQADKTVAPSQPEPERERAGADIAPYPDGDITHLAKPKPSLAAFWMSLIVGLSLLAGAVWKLRFETPRQLGGLNEFLVPVAMLIGALLALGGLYYLLKALFKISDD